MVTGGMSGTYTNVVALICYVGNSKHMTLLVVGRESQAVVKIYMKMLKFIFPGHDLMCCFCCCCFCLLACKDGDSL